MVERPAQDALLVYFALGLVLLGGGAALVVVGVDHDVVGAVVAGGLLTTVGVIVNLVGAVAMGICVGLRVSGADGS